TSRRRHTIFDCDWSSDVCSSDLQVDKLIRRRPEIADAEPARQGCRMQKDAACSWKFHLLLLCLCSDGLTNLLMIDRVIRSKRVEIGRASCRERVEDMDDCHRKVI